MLPLAFSGTVVCVGGDTVVVFCANILSSLRKFSSSGPASVSPGGATTVNGGGVRTFRSARPLDLRSLADFGDPYLAFRVDEVLGNKSLAVDTDTILMSGRSVVHPRNHMRPVPLRDLGGVRLGYKVADRLS